MKTIYFLCFLATAALSAKCWDVESSIGIGYRLDSQDAKSRLFTFPALVPYKESNKSLEGIALEGFARLWVPYGLIAVEGDFSWYLSGKTKNVPLVFNANQPTNQSIPLHFSYNTTGQAYDVYGAVGAVIPLLPKGYLSLVPEFGYCIDHQSFERGAQSPEIDHVVLFNVVDLDSSLILSNEKTKRIWWGPFVGGELFIAEKNRIQGEIAYFFHWLDVSQTMNAKEPVLLSIGGTTVADVLIDLHLNSTVKKAWGQRIKGRISYQISDHWKLNAFANYLYYKTNYQKTLFSQESIDVIPTPPVKEAESHEYLWKFWWHALWVSLEASFLY